MHFIFFFFCFPCKKPGHTCAILQSLGLFYKGIISFVFIAHFLATSTIFCWVIWLREFCNNFLDVYIWGILMIPFDMYFSCMSLSLLCKILERHIIYNAVFVAYSWKLAQLIHLLFFFFLCSYFTNTLILPVINGPTEGLALIYTCHFMTAIVGMLPHLMCYFCLQQPVLWNLSFTWMSCIEILNFHYIFFFYFSLFWLLCLSCFP